jgi:hypothetical protein
MAGILFQGYEMLQLVGTCSVKLQRGGMPVPYVAIT